MAGEQVTVRGMEQLRAKFQEIPRALRRRLLRTWLAAGARLVRDEAKRRAPVLASGNASPYRKPGTVRDAIRVRTSKAARAAGNVGVFVNVKPAEGAKFRGGVMVRAKQAGAKSPTDPFYWRWLEFGRSARAGEPARLRVGRNKTLNVKGVRSRRALTKVGAIAPKGFLRAGAARLGEALRVFEGKASAWLEKINATGKVES
jgi:HK97 gp10 family phage protein